MEDAWRKSDQAQALVDGQRLCGGTLRVFRKEKLRSWQGADPVLLKRLIMCIESMRVPSYINSTFGFCLLALVALRAAAGFAQGHPEGTQPPLDLVESDPQAAADQEATLIGRARQLTFEGRRAGEGYFSADGSKMVFQSEREPGNPFFQIYLLDFETGDVDRVSPGTGKTTCAWIHPDGKSVLYASTQDDPAAREKQSAELELRASGQERRYSWDYDPNFDLFHYDLTTRTYTNLTLTEGYDAEGSWSPDGKQIAFASNRNAYQKTLDADQRKHFETDPAYMMDLFIMDADGGNLRQLTDAPGYDGGPFFSPDGKKLCWRRFSEDGATAEIYSMNVDGTDVRRLTQLNAMSWAPYFHPSGQYLIFATNRHGFANFELYLVDAAGRSDPVRVTHTAGFDGLPVFSPDGTKLSWTSNRTTTKQSQIFIGDWNHDEARKRLGLDKAPESPAEPPDLSSAVAAATDSLQQSEIAFTPEDVRRHVEYLCRPELAGRRTGSEGELLAAAYVAAVFDQLGLKPGGDSAGWFQPFEFTSGVALGSNNRLTVNQQELISGKDWVPLSFSKTGPIEPAPIVFAGYGIAAPKDGEQEEYDSFVHLDVTGKWVLVFRFLPENCSPERRQHLNRHSSLRFKAMVARDRGARGLIVVSGPNSQVTHQLVPLQFDGSLSGASIPVVSVTDEVAERWLAAAGKSLKSLQDALDTGEPQMGVALDDSVLSTSIDLVKVKVTGRNVLGRLQTGDQPSSESIVVGAHMDHLGKGAGPSSLARDGETDGIHFGADDNASGVAAVLEVAQYLADRQRQGRLQGGRDILFAAWSGEEMGLIGSSHFVKTFRSGSGEHTLPEDHPHAPANSAEASIYPAIAACINMDMVGRMEKKLILQGVGSSPIWRSEIEKRNAVVGLPIAIQEDSYLPTDASSFFMKGVPILSAFTGSHSDYHTPRDTPDKLNYEGAARIAQLMALVTQSLSRQTEAPAYVAQAAPAEGQRRAKLRAYLGTVPDYAESDAKGVQLSGVSKGGPAELGGLKGGDLIVSLAGRKIENIYDYTYAIEALKIGEKITIVVLRNGNKVELEIVPGSRD
jgi:Tol biopolymer transport system component